jgi:NTP pyrophosphatase (non-canonical NTP hydrolase)
MIDLSKIKKINKGLYRRFGKNKEPFSIMTRLLEEAGELAQVVNHFENQGSKNERYGSVHDPKRLGEEAVGVLINLMQIVEYYQGEHSVSEAIDAMYNRFRDKGWIK